MALSWLCSTLYSYIHLFRSGLKLARDCMTKTTSMLASCASTRKFLVRCLVPNHSFSHRPSFLSRKHGNMKNTHGCQTDLCSLADLSASSSSSPSLFSCNPSLCSEWWYIATFLINLALAIGAVAGWPTFVVLSRFRDVTRVRLSERSLTHSLLSR